LYKSQKKAKMEQIFKRIDDSQFITVYEDQSGQSYHWSFREAWMNNKSMRTLETYAHQSPIHFNPVDKRVWGFLPGRLFTPEMYSTDTMR